MRVFLYFYYITGSFTSEGLKYEYYVSPEANLNDLQVKVAGANIKENEKTLALETLNQNTSNSYTPITLLDDKLYTYTKESKKELKSSFVINENNTYSFKVDLREPREETIVIDPVVYSTYIDGADFDEGQGIGIDSSGNAYIAGHTRSSETQNFPICPLMPGAYKAYNGNTDAFVMKLSADGSQILYATYIGGNDSDYGSNIDVDSEGKAYITGYTRSSQTENFPICPSIPGAYKVYSGDTEVFVMKLSSDGSQLLYSTYIGGTENEYGSSIAVDTLGNAYISGNTRSSETDNFPICPLIPGPYKVYGGNYDAFVVKLSSDGSQLLYSTYIGGHRDDYGTGIAVDSERNAYVTGYTYSSELQNFPICPLIPGPYKVFGGDTEVFVMKLSSDGSQLLYSTYIGGTENEYGSSIAIDTLGNAYIAGITGSSETQNFPICPLLPGPYKVYGGNYDAFVVKLSSDGSQLLYSTYIGGTENENETSIAVDTLGNTYIAGNTESSELQNFPICPLLPGPYKVYGGNYDIFVIKLSADGSKLLYSTYIGGTEYENGRDIAIDTLGSIYLTGYTNSSETQNFPICPLLPGPYKVYGGNYDAFVVKLSTCPPPTLINPVDLAVNVVVAPTFKWESTPEIPGETYILEILHEGSTIYTSNAINKTSFVLSANILTYSKDYQWRVKKSISQWSQLFTFTTLSSPPNLNISATSNGKSFYTGDDIVYKVSIINLGQTKDTNLKVSVTFPTTITYQSSTLGRGNVLPSGELVLNINQIAGNETITFNITGGVTTSINNATNATTVFKLTSEISQSSQTHVTVILKRKQSGVDRLNAKLRLEGLVYDSQTGKYYLPVGKDLTINVTITGFSTPFSYKLYWGDGQTKEETNQTNTTWSNTHTYKDKGTMTLKLVIQDSKGRQKTVSVNVEVK